MERHFSVGHWTYDHASGSIFWSNGFRRLTGKLLEAPTIDQHYRLVHPDDRWLISEMLASKATNESHLIRVLRNDGQQIIVSCQLDILLDGDARPHTRIVIVRDVSDQQLWTERVQRQQTALAALTSAGELAVWRMSEQGEILEAQGWAAQGQGRIALRAHDWLDDVHPSEQDALRVEWLKAFAVKQRFEAVCRLKNPEGGYLTSLFTVMPIMSNGQLFEWLGVARHRPQSAEEIAFEDGPSPAQLRGCRGLLGWSIGELSAHSAVSAATITRYETTAGSTGAMRRRNLVKLRETLCAHGIVFLTSGAIRLR